jgi:carbonic anhydrase
MSQEQEDNALQQLIAGVEQFRRTVYPERKDAYQESARYGQNPHTLFITCADSRIDPELLTQSGPGQIFVTRNIGNLVPAYGEMMGGVSAVIEYAVSGLNVSHVVICGHTDCGAMKALLHPEKLETMPTVKSWLRNAHAALSVVRASEQEPPENLILDALTEQNVLLQMNHLRTHPSVAGKVANRKMTISGWVYDIAHGTVRIHSEAEGKFLPLEHFIAGVRVDTAAS